MNVGYNDNGDKSIDSIGREYNVLYSSSISFTSAAYEERVYQHPAGRTA